MRAVPPAAGPGPLAFEVLLRGSCATSEDSANQAWLHALLSSMAGVQRARVDVTSWEVLLVRQAGHPDDAVRQATAELDEAMRELGWDQWRGRWPVTGWAVTPVRDRDLPS